MLKGFQDFCPKVVKPSITGQKVEKITKQVVKTPRVFKDLCLKVIISPGN